MRQVLGVLPHADERHLVGAERALDLHAVDHRRARSSPSGVRSTIAGQRGRAVAAPPRAAAPGSRGSSRAGSRRAPRRSSACTSAGSSPSTTSGLVAVAARAARATSSSLRPAEHRRARDLVAVEVQDRQHGAVAGGVEEAHALPRALERPGLGLAVADDAGDQQVGVVERRAEGVHERVAELAALVDRARAWARSRGWGCRPAWRTAGTAARRPAVVRASPRG